jgi:hypothetical protein
MARAASSLGGGRIFASSHRHEAELEDPGCFRIRPGGPLTISSWSRVTPSKLCQLAMSFPLCCSLPVGGGGVLPVEREHRRKRRSLRSRSRRAGTSALMGCPRHRPRRRPSLIGPTPGRQIQKRKSRTYHLVRRGRPRPQRVAGVCFPATVTARDRMRRTEMAVHDHGFPVRLSTRIGDSYLCRLPIRRVRDRGRSNPSLFAAPSRAYRMRVFVMIEPEFYRRFSNSRTGRPYFSSS